MSDLKVQESPSKTAVFAAVHRTLAHGAHGGPPFGPDRLASVFLPAPLRFLFRFAFLRNRVRRKIERLVPGLHAYMIARTAFFDRWFADALAAQVPQIVLLGAGYDTRAFRLARQNRCSRIFELDIAPTQQRKRACLKRAMIDLPDWLTLAPIDFERDSLSGVLAAAGWDGGQATAFLWEGVSYYLDPAAVDATLAFVRDHAGPGGALAFDFSVARSRAEAGDAYGSAAFFTVLERDHPGEAFRFSLDDEQAGEFLARRGFSHVRLMNPAEIEAAFLSREDGSSLGPVCGHFRFAEATPDQASPVR